MRWVLVVGILVAVAYAASVQIDVDNYVFIEAKGLAHVPFYWNGSVFLPAPVVYFVRYENVSWLEVWKGGKPVEVSAPLAEGPYLAVPREALNKTRPPRGVPVDTPRGRAWIYLTKTPAAEGLPPYGVVLYLNATGEPPGVYRGRPIIKSSLRVAKDEGPLFAPAVSAYQDYLFTFQTNSLYVGSWWAALPFKNATGLSSSGYVLGTAYRAYLGYRVAYIYLAVAGSGTFSAKLDIYCGDAPTSAAYCRTLTPLYSYTTDLGAVFVFDNWNDILKYVWVSAYLQSSTAQTVRTFLSANYRRAAPSDSNWGHLVFEWRSIFADGYTTALPSGTRRVMFTAQVPEGSSTPTLVITTLQIVNCAGRSTQTVRIYVGGRPVYQTTVSGSGAGPCYTFTVSGVNAQAASALDYPRFNTSFVPVIIEFDPALSAYGNTQPSVSLTGAELRGNRWPQIWRESASNFITVQRHFGIRRPPYMPGNSYSFNVWSGRDLKVNESSYGLIAKFLIETTPMVVPLSVPLSVEFKSSIQYVGIKYGAISPIWYYVCTTKSTTGSQRLAVSGPGTSTDWGLWGTVVQGAYWWANTILTFISLVKNVPSWLGIVMWGAGEMISKLFPSSSVCTINTYTGLSYNSGLTSAITAAFYNITIPLNAVSTTPLSSSNVDIAIHVGVLRDPSDPRDNGGYILYGKYKAPFVGSDVRGSWFDAPFEPYVLDGGIMVRAYPS